MSPNVFLRKKDRNFSPISLTFNKGVLHPWIFFLKTLCIFSKSKAALDKVSKGSDQKFVGNCTPNVVLIDFFLTLVSTGSADETNRLIYNRKQEAVNLSPCHSLTCICKSCPIQLFSEV